MQECRQTFATFFLRVDSFAWKQSSGGLFFYGKVTFLRLRYRLALSLAYRNTAPDRSIDTTSHD